MCVLVKLPRLNDHLEANRTSIRLVEFEDEEEMRGGISELLLLCLWPVKLAAKKLRQRQ